MGARERKLKKGLADATTYAEWREAAESLDKQRGNDRWRAIDHSSQFDAVSIRQRLDRLRFLRARHDYRGLLFTLNEGIHGNMGGMGKASLYERALTGTKNLIVDYVEEIVEALELLASDEVEDISFEEKLDFFRRAHHCFGRSAMLLSGSGMLLYFHVGVVRALLKEGLLPTILSGSSGGAVVGAYVSSRTDKELEELLEPEHLVHELEEQKSLLGLVPGMGRQALAQHHIEAMIGEMIPDLTFEEAFNRSGRMLNVSIAPAETHQTSRLLNATTSPNVLIRKACLASAAVPGIYLPVTLQARDSWGELQDYLPSRKWVDGSVSDDLPTKRLSRLYGVNHYIVSQTNPAVLPFVSDTRRQRGALPVLANTARRTAREWLNAGAQILNKPLSKETGFSKVANTLLSVVNQDYVGDIMIMPQKKFAHPMRILHSLTLEEATKLITEGERATWRRMEMIRVQTRISSVLDEIVHDYEEDYVGRHAASGRKRKSRRGEK